MWSVQADRPSKSRHSVIVGRGHASSGLGGCSEYSKVGVLNLLTATASTALAGATLLLKDVEVCLNPII